MQPDAFLKDFALLYLWKKENKVTWTGKLEELF